MARSLIATVAAAPLAQLAFDRLLVLANGAALEAAPAGFDALICVEPRGHLPCSEFSRALVVGGWLAVAAIDKENRFHSALAELAPGDAEPRLDLLAGELSRAGFADVELMSHEEELRVVPTQEWLLANISSAAGKTATERAALARAMAGGLRDLWRGDAFRVPVIVQCVYARKGGAT